MELRHALHHGRELESIRMQSEEAGHSCVLGSGGSIFLYPQQYTAVQAVVRRLQLKPHFLVVNEAFLPLKLQAFRSIPSKANVLPRPACFLALVDDEGNEVCVVEKHSVSGSLQQLYRMLSQSVSLDMTVMLLKPKEFGQFS